mmetsp:Transcript_74266/g.135662  ORF Transcript_74266/g.135662 Transcript_74266/m.135662 type:complete len:524 (-) Transcript_74266:108-1679(-)
MCKVALVVAYLVCASHGLPSQPPVQAQNSQEAKSLAQLLLTHKSGGSAFYPSGSNANPSRLSGAGRSSDVFSRDLAEIAYDTISSLGRTLTASPEEEESAKRVNNAILKIERDAQMLDVSASAKQQVKPMEMGVLATLFAVSLVSPYFLAEKVVETLVPSMAALAAIIGANAEYNGKAAVARGKQVGAISLQAAAESEMYFAQAERAAAIIPVAVGISAAFGAVALTIPGLIEELAVKGITGEISTEIFLVCPIISILSAAVAALSNQECGILAQRAVNLGARRFSSAREVGRTWLSASEQVTQASLNTKAKWSDFALGVLPAPFFGFLFPGALEAKCIVAAAIAALQAAISLAQSEYSLSQAMESVATKTRSAAVTDTYANQGMRAGAVLPFTSAVGIICAASTVAIVEFTPFLGTITQEAIVGSIFPGLGVLVAAAASIAKARAEVDAEAATAAATLLSESPAQRNDPFKSTYELLRYTIRNIRKQSKRGPVAPIFNALKTILRTLTLGLLFRDQSKLSAR